MEKITAVLIEKKDTYPQIVLERLTLGFFHEIIIETNCTSIYRRYELAQQAESDIIYFQDSDCLVNYQQLWKHFDGRLTNTITLPFQKRYDEMGCTLVGWGCFINRSMLSVFDKYIAKYGKDEHLYREADRIFTYLNKPFNTIIMPHEDLFQNEDDRMSSPKNVEFHFKSANEALRKCSLL